MKKLITKICLVSSALFILGGNYKIKASEISNTVVDLGIETTTEATTEAVGGEAVTDITNTTGNTGSTNGVSEDVGEWSTQEVTDITADLVPNVKPENFFSRVYNKTFLALSGVQKIVAVILIFFFILNTIMVVVACFGQKNKVPWHLLAMLLCILMFICDIYAVPIVKAISNWFVS